MSKKIKRITYSPVVADLFHYGHLRSLEFANSIGDYHICGVLSDEATQTTKRKPIANLEERKAVVSGLKCVDEVIIQEDFDPIINLKKIRERFPDVELLVVLGSNWRKYPAASSLQQIGARLVQHPYYAGLSDFRIINKLFEHYKNLFKDFETFTKFFKIQEFSEGSAKAKISTKADTLKSLQLTLKNGKIEDSFVFTVAEWESNEQYVLNQIQEFFSGSEKIVVRSSALNEDSLENSMAGYFYSELDVKVRDKKEIKTAVEKVIETYTKKNSYHTSNQILVQRQTKDPKCSGVIFTRQLETNNPYYVINYDDVTGLTDTVTKGLENKVVYISRSCDEENFPANLQKVLLAVKEIESLLPNMELDIEFAVNKDGEVVIFQVRPMSVNIKSSYNLDVEVKEKIEDLKQQFSNISQRQEHLAGDNTIFADMPDWNPAEIIGSNPNYLDYSLYDYIITDSAWHKARTSQNYYDVNPAKLVVLFGNKPYINVRNTFNSFVPSPVSKKLRGKLVDFYINKLRNNQELQDKVEFKVLYTCYDLGFEKRSKELKEAGFSNQEIAELRTALLDLTNNLFANKEDIKTDLNTAKNMEAFRKKIHDKVSKGVSTQEKLSLAVDLLDNCVSQGTVQFSRLARLAFIGKIILNSLSTEGIIEKTFYQNFMNSIYTVASKMNDDFNTLVNGELSKEKFLNLYGHLRPGTYDITVQRYDKNPDLLGGKLNSIQQENKESFEIDGAVHKKISDILKEHGLIFNSKELFAFTKDALESREFSKFEFSKNLSDAMELIADAGRDLGFSRELLSQLDINSIKLASEIEDIGKIKSILETVIEHRIGERRINNSLILPPIIQSWKDFEVVSSYKPKPNFTTQKRVEADIFVLTGNDTTPNLENKIVLIENGDPGYDWIFTKKPAGLITKYGGVASHMSIRCAEFGLPAAIGCGELFEQIKGGKTLLLDCKKENIKIVK